MRAVHRAYDLLTRPLRSHRLFEAMSDEVKAFRRTHTKWMKDANVTGIGVGMRESRGRRTDEPALRVYVQRKKTGGRLGDILIPAVLRVPGHRDAVCVDVVEARNPRLHAGPHCGDGIYDATRVAGTLGFLAIDHGTPSLLSCMHVLNGASGSDVFWLGGPTISGNGVERVASITQNGGLSSGPDYPNLIDATVAALDEAVDASIWQLGPLLGIRTSPVLQDEPLSFFGAASAKACQGTVTAVRASREINYSQMNTTYGFQQLIECTAVSREGDSGSAVVDAQGRLVGMLIGGDERHSYCTPISFITTLLGITIPTRSAAPMTAPTLAPAVDVRARAIDTLARTLWGEARGETLAGREAVASVVLNRSRIGPNRYPATIEAVCKQPYQFSCWNANDRNRAKLLAVNASNAAFVQCQDIARRAVEGMLIDRTRGSTHYLVSGTPADWAEGHIPVEIIGRHAFYNDIA
ncbi:MAG: cell wall hydrolase [Dokdonella sp.]